MAIVEHPDRGAPLSATSDASAADALERDAVRLMVREIFAEAGPIDTEDDLHEWLARSSPANRFGARSKEFFTSYQDDNSENR